METFVSVIKGHYGQNTRIEKLELELESLKESTKTHIQKSDILEELLRKLSEASGLSKYIIDDMKKDIEQLQLKRNGNGNNYSRSAI